MSREAMQMALWTLEGWANHDNWVWPESALEQSKRNTIEAITALRQALETKQEPVAWRSTSPDGKLSNELFVGTSKEVNWTPIYTEPPKQWVGLTALEIYECWKTGDVVDAVEAKLKEKNHG